MASHFLFFFVNSSKAFNSLLKSSAFIPVLFFCTAVICTHSTDCVTLSAFQVYLAKTETESRATFYYMYRVSGVTKTDVMLSLKSLVPIQL